MADRTIKIPEKHYVGMVKRQTEKIPLGFMTPWGEDAAAKKRMATVDTWANRGYNSTKLEPMIIDNKPLNGFKMTTDIRSSSYGGSDKWRIEDPRGFELEITSHNLAELLSVGMIDRGEIMDTCVWARDGQQNVLLSTSTPEYKAAVRNTEVAGMTASWTDVKIGDTVLLQNNITGVWLGRMFGTYYKYSASLNQSHIAVSDKSFHLIHITDYNERNYTSKLLIVSSPKLASIVLRNEKTELEAEIIVNKLLKDERCEKESSGYNSYLTFTFGSPKFGKDAVLTLEEVAVSSGDNLHEQAYRGHRGLIFMKSVDALENVVSYHYGSNREFDLRSFSLDEFKNSKLMPISVKQTVNHGWYRGNKEETVQRHSKYTYKPGDTFYKVLLTVTSKNGNVLERVVK